MNDISLRAFDSPYKGSGSLTREQFYFYETRITAKLLLTELADEEVVDLIATENLFQYPTERTIQDAARACLRRLHALKDDSLVRAMAESDSITSKQICLYAMMCQYRLIWDFMITVIGNKYRRQDYTYSRREINEFLLGLQEHDELVASWSDTTVRKISSVISRILIENEYIDGGKTSILNPVLINSTLENAIRASGNEPALLAFNCLS